MINTWNNKTSTRTPAAVPANAGFTSALKVYNSKPKLPLFVHETTSLVELDESASSAPAKPLEKGQARLNFGRSVVSIQQDNVATGGFSYQAASVMAAPHTASVSSDFAQQLASTIRTAPDAVPTIRKAFIPPKLFKASIKPMSKTSSGRGSLELPETRQSRINDAVLLNPEGNPKTDLNRFETLAKQGLDKLKNLGEPDVKVDKPQGAFASAQGGESAPRAGASLKRGFESPSKTGKKPKQ